MKKYIIIALGLALFSSCTKDEVEGPELQDIFGEFGVVTPLTTDRSTVDFSAGESVAFNAELTIRTDWTLHIIGLSSGAKKEIKGREREITQEVARWNGSITFAPLFGEEECSVYMTFDEHPDTLFADNITVEGVKPEDSINILISDFETGTGWGTFAEAAATNQNVNGSYFIADPVNQGEFLSVAAPEGNRHWRMTYTNINSVFICGANTLAAASQDAEADNYFSIGTNNPENVYLNLLLYGLGDGNTRCSIGLQEDDNLDGEYDRFTEGTYNTTIEVDWQGWKVVSIPLSNFQLSTVGGFGNNDATGNQDIDRILSMEVLLLAAEGTTGPVGFGMDYLNFTYFSPWTP